MSKSKFTFKKDRNLFDQEVLMVFSNLNKKLIVSIGEEHIKQMIDNGYDPDDEQAIVKYIKDYGYDN